ncbi:MAG: Flp pilus assembly protein CpaB [Dethiobacter sp.]|nr:Flp pilus assembly protein CpaB [Dethiobacter sp.]MBS3900039.1 Flp pilus assembly protein CpaB [Dethiobacter sp.]
MKGKKLLLLSFLFAVAAAGAVYAYLNQIEQKSKMAADTVSVLIAKQEIPARTKLDGSMFIEIDVPRVALHHEALTDKAALAGAFARERMVSGEQVLSTRLVFTQDNHGLAYKVSVGYRAVTIPVNSVSGVAGYILPGDFVDCIVTIDPPVEGSQTVTALVAANIRVLASGQYTFNENEEVLIVDTLTLDVPAERVTALIQASERGSLRLVLRSVAENSGRQLQPHRINQFQ